MATNEESNMASASTTWAWKRVKISRPPEARSAAAGGRPHWRALARRDPRQPLNMTIKVRGGAECWVEVRARGVVYRTEGWRAIYDVLCDLNNVHGGKPPKG